MADIDVYKRLQEGDNKRPGHLEGHQIFNMLSEEDIGVKRAIGAHAARLDEEVGENYRQVREFYGGWLTSVESEQRNVSQQRKGCQTVPKTHPTAWSRIQEFEKKWRYINLWSNPPEIIPKLLLGYDLTIETNTDSFNSFVLDICSGLRDHIANNHGDSMDYMYVNYEPFLFYENLQNLYRVAIEIDDIQDCTKARIYQLADRILFLCDASYNPHDLIPEDEHRDGLVTLNERMMMKHIAQVLRVLLRVETQNPDISRVFKEIRQHLSDYADAPC